MQRSGADSFDGVSCRARESAKGGEPVWINKQADMARARDALRYHEMVAKEAEKRAGEVQETARACAGKNGVGMMGRAKMRAGDGARTSLGLQSTCSSLL